MPTDYEQLEARIGPVHLALRLAIQADHTAYRLSSGRARLHPENWDWLPAVLAAGLTCLGLRQRGRRNAAQVVLRRRPLVIPRLPVAFDGLVVLQLSDVHLDGSDAVYEGLLRCLAGVKCDVAVVTGDFRFDTRGPYGLCVERMAQVRRCVDAPMYGILGNHDCVEMVPELERIGVRMLVNESVAIERQGARFHLVGVDDTHFYLADNLEKALAPLPRDDVKLLLSHSPELYRQARYCGIDAMLSGHTHAGQICLPGGRPLVTHAACPRYLCRGSWRFGPLVGYTSAGTGSSGLDARFNCPPEALQHVLRTSPGPGLAAGPAVRLS